MRKNECAFTLFELLCVLASFLILAVMSVNAWGQLSNKIHLTLAVARIKEAIAYARYYAIQRQSRIVYCGSRDLTNCDGVWQLGQIIKDLDHQKILKIYSKFDPKVALDFIANFHRNHALQFLPNGFSNGQNGHFILCLGSSCRSLTVHFSGEVVEHKAVLNPGNVLH